MADNTDRKMLLVAFLQASNCSNYTGSTAWPCPTVSATHSKKRLNTASG